MLSKENNMKQDRYVIFTSEKNQGLETILGTYPNSEHKYLGNTPEAIAKSMKELGITNDHDIFYSSGMEFGTEVGFETNEAPIELFERACIEYSSMLTSNQ
jgi:hypothetical protein